MQARLIFLFTMLLFLAGCSSKADMGAADQAVPKFHRMLDAGKFAEIYTGGSAELKKASTEKDFVALLEAIHRKLGNSGRTEKIGWHVNYHTSGTVVTVTYKTAYAGGEAQEQFVFLVHDNVAALAGYHINSTALILN